MLIPFFSGCQKDDKIQLNIPVSVNFDINEDTEKQIIYTQSNPFASGYLFGISENENADIDDYIKYRTENNYLDVTDIFVNAKTYYFYAQYIGSGKYVSSKISAIETYTVQYKLNTPSITIDGTIISWLAIPNADSYSIYSKVGSNIEIVSSTSNTTFDIASDINKKITQENVEESISYFIVATSQGNYLRSTQSNIVTYSAFLQLEVPSNVQFVASGANKFLQWKEVEHCDNYVIRINYASEINVSSSQCTKSGVNFKYDLADYLEEHGLGDYAFCIKANNTNNYLASTYSNEVFYTYTKQLETPSNVVITDQNPNILITWSEVENANQYELYYSDTINNYELKKFVVNNGGVEGIITTNAIVVTYEQLNISSFSTIKNSRFMIQIKVKGYGYYLDSNLSTIKLINEINEVDDSIDAPHIVDNASISTISWNPVSNAVKYKVIVYRDSISDSNILVNTIITNTSYNYSGDISSSGKYQIVCFAISSKNIESAASNIVAKETYTSFDAPVLNDINVEDSCFVLDFTEPLNASTYTLYVNNNLITDQITSQNKSVPINTVLVYKINNEIEFSMRANAAGYYTSSDISNKLLISTKLSTPQISVASGNKNLTWNPIKYATSYVLILDDVSFVIDNVISAINLQNYVNVNTARQVRLQAKNQYFEDSDVSSMIYYNRADQTHVGYTDKYFYFGQTYDYYITSAQEMADVVEYTFLNRLTSVNIYVNFDSSTTIGVKRNNACSLLVGTKSYAPYITNSGNKIGPATLEFKFSPITDEPTYDPIYTQYENDMIYSQEKMRSDNYEFDTDNYFVSQDVWTTDGLLSAIQHNAKPNFVDTNSIAEEVYNIAKEILIGICNDQMTDYQKALAIHDYIIENVAYDTDGLENVSSYNDQVLKTAGGIDYVDVNDLLLGRFHNIEGALIDGLAVCDGYSKAYALLCNMENINCIVVSGLDDKEDNSSGHAWNKIYFDFDSNGEKEWFAVDCTHDDKIVNGTKQYLTHINFLIPDTYLSDRSENKDYPVAEQDGEQFYSYFKYDGAPLKIDTENKLWELIAYANSHSTFKLELLVPAQYLSYLNSPTYSAFISFGFTSGLTYKYNTNYKVVHVYK